MTQTELVDMLKAMNARQQAHIADLRVELEEAQAVIKQHTSTQRTLTNALSVAKGGLQVRKECQSSHEMLRLAIEGLLTNEILDTNPQNKEAYTFAHKILTLTEKEQF
jgi:hypothetical protein